MATRESILETYRDTILEGMARTLWLYAYADYIEEIGDKSADEQELPRALAGQDWDDVAPETPKAAMKAAKELVKLYEASKGTGDIVELYGLAQTVDMEEDFEFELSQGKIGRTVGDRWKIADAGLFGSMLASMALGHGVSWFDDHKKFELARVNFECTFDGEDLNWHGGSSDVREVSGKLGSITILNQSDADIFGTGHSYVLWFGMISPKRVLVYASCLDDAVDELIDWVAEEYPGMIIDEEVQEEFERQRKAGLSNEEAWEQAEIDTTSGGNAGNHINSDEWGIIAEDPTEEQLQEIAFGKRNGGTSGKCINSHASLDDLILDFYDANTAEWMTAESAARGGLGDIKRITERMNHLASGGFLKKSEGGYSITKKGLERAVSRHARNRRPNPTHAVRMKTRHKAEAVLAKRRAVGLEGACDDPNCKGWDVFENEEGLGVQACDMCNAEAKRQGLPVLYDSDAKELAAAQKALQRAVREGR